MAETTTQHSYQKLRKSMNKSHSLLLVLCWQHTWSAHSTIDISVELDYQAASCATPSRSIQGNYRLEYHQLEWFFGFGFRAEEKYWLFIPDKNNISIFYSPLFRAEPLKNCFNLDMVLWSLSLELIFLGFSLLQLDFQLLVFFLWWLYADVKSQLTFLDCKKKLLLLLCYYTIFWNHKILWSSCLFLIRRTRPSFSYSNYGGGLKYSVANKINFNSQSAWRAKLVTKNRKFLTNGKQPWRKENFFFEY